MADNPALNKNEQLCPHRRGLELRGKTCHSYVRARYKHLPSWFGRGPVRPSLARQVRSPLDSQICARARTLMKCTDHTPRSCSQHVHVRAHTHAHTHAHAHVPCHFRAHVMLHVKCCHMLAHLDAQARKLITDGVRRAKVALDSRLWSLRQRCGCASKGEGTRLYLFSLNKLVKYPLIARVAIRLPTPFGKSP